ncbi:hypothetical protein Fcan01_23319 [Folsomia candida]|uniref:Uncharacterized protein n=1 Tax=Folsomia candida TaxID=158441 RepID=A0A226D959_FOLCA|nr:hypothetical protein Fcan01_23319 [Folsomia candida]
MRFTERTVSNTRYTSKCYFKNVETLGQRCLIAIRNWKLGVSCCFWSSLGDCYITTVALIGIMIVQPSLPRFFGVLKIGCPSVNFAIDMLQTWIFAVLAQAFCFVVATMCTGVLAVVT